MRENWNAVVNEDKLMKYIICFRQVQDNIGCRKLFNRAIQTSNDEPEKLCELYLKFEKEEGLLKFFKWFCNDIRYAHLMNTTSLFF